MAETYKELRSLPRDELIERHDDGCQYVQVGINHYLAELRHRDRMALLSNIAEHASTVARCADIIAMYFLAKWKFDHEIGKMSKPPTAFLHDPRNKKE